MTQAKHIFLVDDDHEDQEIFINALLQIDASINYQLANNGYEALEKLNESSNVPDLILMDINMPLMDGFACLAELRKHARLGSIPVAMLTTSNNPADEHKAHTLGADFFLTKPNMVSELINNIRNLLTNLNWHSN